MNETLKPYSAYKDSGVPWLGKIPGHWELPRTKILLRERIQKGFPKEPLLAATQTRGVVKKEQYENRTVLALKDLHLLKLVRVKDFVISLRSFQGGIEYAREQGIISPAYTILYLDDDKIHGYMAWLFKSKPYIENLKLHVTGIRQGQNVDYERLSRSRLPLPSLDDQSAIVRFLDYTDRRIRRYIHTKQKLIALLNEQKQAIIHKAVTRGLDPNVRLKPSGVEWLGDVPEHWEVKKLKEIARLIVSNVDKHSKEGEVPVLLCNYTDVYYNETISDRLEFMPATATPEEIQRFRIRIGDVIITKDSEIWNDIGVPTLVKHESPILLCGYHLAILRPISMKLDGEFLFRLLQSRHIASQLYVAANGITRYGLSQQSIKDMRLLLPPSHERTSIVSWLRDELENLSVAKSKAEKEISLIKEYRTRLIADVVTGKLDVREVAARLPLEPEESEVMEETEPLQDTEESSNE